MMWVYKCKIVLSPKHILVQDKKWLRESMLKTWQVTNPRLEIKRGPAYGTYSISGMKKD